MRVWLSILAASLWIAAPAGAAEAEHPPAAPVVEHLQDTLLELMRRVPDMSEAQRTHALDTLISETHDLDYIARVALGRHWRDLDPGEQAAFVERFRTLSVASYASRFSSFSGESFRVEEETTLPLGQHQVRSILTTASGDEHEFTYLLRASDPGWRIVNIIVDGVSDLALKRAEYNKLMQDGSFPDLLAELDQQTQRLRAGNPGG